MPSEAADMSSEAANRDQPAEVGTTVEVFWRPGCPYCQGLRSVLLDQGVDATWRNIWTDAEARALVREANHGDETVPTVRVGTTVLTNPSWRQLAPVLAGMAAAPGAAAAPGHPASGTAVPPSGRGGPRVAGLRWALIGLLVVASEVLAHVGRLGASYAVDALALGSWWLTRPAR